MTTLDRANAPGFAAHIITLLPDIYPGPLGASLAGRARDMGSWSLNVHDLRDWGVGKHKNVDDTPAGGGAGMVLRPDVLAAALDSVVAQGAPGPVLAMSPRGKRLDQAMVRDLASGPGVTILCGRFEGMDERIFAARPVLEVSIGDYILSGGDAAALALLDAVVRLLPGVMGAAQSGVEESFEGDLLEYPHYTKPADFEGHAIPDVLISGDHGRVAAWRRDEAARITRERRPDLWARLRAAVVDAQGPEGEKKQED